MVPTTFHFPSGGHGSNNTMLSYGDTSDSGRIRWGCCSWTCILQTALLLLKIGKGSQKEISSEPTSDFHWQKRLKLDVEHMGKRPCRDICSSFVRNLSFSPSQRRGGFCRKI